MGAKTYPKPPVIEAIFKAVFSPESPWDYAAPGLIYSRMAPAYPTKKQATATDSGLPVETQPHDVIRFFSEDGKDLIQLQQRQLNVHRLLPYISWDQYMPKISEAVLCYQEVVGPSPPLYLFLRYINRFALPEFPVNLSKYLNFHPIAGDGRFGNFSTFMVGAQFPFSDSRDGLRIELVPGEALEGNPPALILDLSYFTVQPRAVNIDAVIPWVEQAHSKVVEGFEMAIKDDLRAIFS